MTREPFYPAQTETGSTYVMDGRTSPPRVVSTITCSFDTTERWHLARLRAFNMNCDYARQLYWRRQRRVIVALLLFVVLAVVELGTGALSSFAEGVINAVR